MGCKPYDAVYAIPGRHIASSVGVFDLRSEIPSGPGESWVLGRIHCLQHYAWGFPALANREEAGEKLACFFFSFSPMW